MLSKNFLGLQSSFKPRNYFSNQKPKIIESLVMVDQNFMWFKDLYSKGKKLVNYKFPTVSWTQKSVAF